MKLFFEVFAKKAKVYCYTEIAGHSRSMHVLAVSPLLVSVGGILHERRVLSAQLPSLPVVDAAGGNENGRH